MRANRGGAHCRRPGPETCSRISFAKTVPSRAWRNSSLTGPCPSTAERFDGVKLRRYRRAPKTNLLRMPPNRTLIGCERAFGRKLLSPPLLDNNFRAGIREHLFQLPAAELAREGRGHLVKVRLSCVCWLLQKKRQGAAYFIPLETFTGPRADRRKIF